MGVKLRLNVNPLEASVKEGKLNIYFFDKIIKEIELKIPKAVCIERQTNFLHTAMNRVVVYLKGDNYILIIRIDGTVDILTNNFILVFTTSVPIGQIMDHNLVISSCGHLSFDRKVQPAYLAETYNKEVFIYSPNIPATILLDLNDETSRSIYNWSKAHDDDVGSIKIYDNATGLNSLWANFGTKNNMEIKNFKTLKSDGFIGGILL